MNDVFIGCYSRPLDGMRVRIPSEWARIFRNMGGVVAVKLPIGRLALTNKRNCRKIIVETEFADETWEYDDRDQRCCAICLSSLGDMHSESGVAVRRRSAEVYAELLPRFADACTK